MFVSPLRVCVEVVLLCELAACAPRLVAPLRELSGLVLGKLHGDLGFEVRVLLHDVFVGPLRVCVEVVLLCELAVDWAVRLSQVSPHLLPCTCLLGNAEFLVMHPLLSVREGVGDGGAVDVGQLVV